MDRRYWCLDYRLDVEHPVAVSDPYSSFQTDTAGYTIGSGRPIGPDMVADVLDRTDQLRELRYSWLKFRVNKKNGSLPVISRFVKELPERIAEQEEYLRLVKSLQG